MLLSQVRPVELRPPSDMEDCRTIVDAPWGGGFIKSGIGFKVRFSPCGCVYKKTSIYGQ